MGGNVTQAWEECRALARAGASVTVHTTQLAAGASANDAHRVVDGVEIHYHPRTAGYWRAFSLGLTLACLRAPRRFDVIHLNSPWQFANPFAALAAARARKPYVISLRGTFMPWALSDHWARKRPYFELVESRVLAGASAIVASNEREAHIARERWPSATVATIAGIVDVDRFRHTPAGDLRGRFGIGAAAPLVLFVGRNHPVKGLDLLIAGFQLVAARIPTARLLVAGPEHRGTHADLVQHVRAAGLTDRVVLAGMLSEEEKVLAYHSADVVVMPSRQEGFGQVAAEAMAAGRPVVVTSECGIARLVAEGGAGVVVPVEANPIGDAIADLLADPPRREGLGRRAAELAVARFSGDSIARTMLGVYERALSAPR